MLFNSEGQDANGATRRKTPANASINEATDAKVDAKEPYSKANTTLFQSTPEPSAQRKVLRAALLWTYFWTCVFILAITQYIGAPLYLIKKDYYYRYMAFTKEGMAVLILSMTQWWTSTEVHISGDDSVKDQIRLLPNGRLECNFSDRLVLIANHQMYNDWVYLWHAAYLSHNSGALTIVLKDSIKYIPIVGTGLRMAGFVFMSRKMKTDQPRLTRRLAQLTRRDSDTGKRRPMWLLMFPEGTNLSRNGRAASKKWADREGIDDLKYQLIPRSTGTYFCLKGLDGTVEWVYDCTIAYDGITPGQYGQDTHTLPSTYISGHPPPIHTHWRRFPTSSIPLSSLSTFDAWLQARWLEKEALLEHHARTGRFPSALGEGKGGEVRTEVKLGSWTELWRIGGVLGGTGVVYGLFTMLRRSMS